MVVFHIASGIFAVDFVFSVQYILVMKTTSIHCIRSNKWYAFVLPMFMVKQF